MCAPPRDFCYISLQDLYCIYILLDELQEPVDPRKQPLPNQFASLKVSWEKQS